MLKEKTVSKKGQFKNMCSDEIYVKICIISYILWNWKWLLKNTKASILTNYTHDKYLFHIHEKKW